MKIPVLDQFDYSLEGERADMTAILIVRSHTETMWQWGDVR